jgi:hypothetical protein
VRTKTERIIEHVLTKVSFGGPKHVLIGPPRAAGRQRCRSLTVEGHALLDCSEIVANKLQKWIEQRAGSKTTYQGIVISVGKIEQVANGLRTKIAIIGPEKPHSSG